MLSAISVCFPHLCFPLTCPPPWQAQFRSHTRTKVGRWAQQCSPFEEVSHFATAQKHASHSHETCYPEHLPPLLQNARTASMCVHMCLCKKHKLFKHFIDLWTCKVILTDGTALQSPVVLLSGPRLSSLIHGISPTSPGRQSFLDLMTIIDQIIQWSDSVRQLHLFMSIKKKPLKHTTRIMYWLLELSTAESKDSLKGTFH